MVRRSVATDRYNSCAARSRQFVQVLIMPRIGRSKSAFTDNKMAYGTESDVEWVPLYIL